MAKYHIIQRQACVVAWRYAVEAETEADALVKYGDGAHGESVAGPEIGDSIDYLQYDLGIEPAGEAAPPAPADFITEALAAARELHRSEPCAGNLPLHDRLVRALERLEAYPAPATADAAVTLVRDLVEWARQTGGWSAAVWNRANDFVDSKGGTVPSPCETAARAAGWVHGGDCDGFIFHKPTWGNWKSAASWAGTDQQPDGEDDKPATYDSWRECCECEDIEVATPAVG